MSKIPGDFEPTEEQVQELENWVTSLDCEYNSWNKESWSYHATELFKNEDIGQRFNYARFDAPRYKADYTIKYNNRFVGAMRRISNYNVGPNYRFFKTEKDAIKFIKTSRYPIYRHVEERFATPFDFSMLKSWKQIPLKQITTWFVMYDDKKLSWGYNKLQLILANMKNPPKWLSNILVKKLAS
jgi:hypothetical protein